MDQFSACYFCTNTTVEFNEIHENKGQLCVNTCHVHSLRKKLLENQSNNLFEVHRRMCYTTHPSLKRALVPIGIWLKKPVLHQTLPTAIIRLPVINDKLDSFW